MTTRSQNEEVPADDETPRRTGARESSLQRHATILDPVRPRESSRFSEDIDVPSPHSPGLPQRRSWAREDRGSGEGDPTRRGVTIVVRPRSARLCATAPFASVDDGGSARPSVAGSETPLRHVRRGGESTAEEGAVVYASRERGSTGDGSAGSAQSEVGVCSPARAEADRCTGDRVVWVRAGPARAARPEVSLRRCWWPCSVDVTGASPGPVAPVRVLAAREEPRTAARPAAVRVRTEEAPAAVAAESSPTVVWCCPPSFPVPRTTC